MGVYASLDEALVALATSGPDLQNGLTNHAPMAIEALCALGRSDAIPAWLDRYRAGFLPRPPAGERIARDGWRSALGRTDRTTEWADFFVEELAEHGWRDVLRSWLPVLAPAHCASAAHGVIRTAHAVRGLLDAETAPRVRELAAGLGYWAACFQTLPAAAGAGPAPTDAAHAMRAVAIVPPERRRFTGTIVSSLEGLAEFPEFAPVIARLDDSPPVAVLLSDLTETFARVYLANAHDVLGTIVFIHAVTGAAAARTLAPFADDARALVRFAWQTGAALYAAFGGAVALASEIEPPRDDAAALIDRAVAHGDEHVIKFTEACLREDAIRPSPAYGAAAAHALRTLPPAA